MSPSPFPGMDPYLESPDLWPDVHATLAGLFRARLNQVLAPKYVAELETRIVIEMPDVGEASERIVLPDVPIFQSGKRGGVGGDIAIAEPAPIQLQALTPTPVRLYTVQIREQGERKLVTAIEILSPVNKRPGEGREEYLEKRQAYLSAGVNLVEIDLLRRYPRMPFGDPVPGCDYLIAVKKRQSARMWSAWPILLRQHLPQIPIPLLPPDPDVPLNIKDALDSAYQQARYDLRIDYRKPAVPPLRAEDEAWMREYLVPLA